MSTGNRNERKHSFDQWAGEVVDVTEAENYGITSEDLLSDARHVLHANPQGIFSLFRNRRSSMPSIVPEGSTLNPSNMQNMPKKDVSFEREVLKKAKDEAFASKERLDEMTDDLKVGASNVATRMTEMSHGKDDIL
eukprot:Colp12_sorted_trinity150504_noHs@9735